MTKISLSDLMQLSVAERIKLVEDLWDSIVEDPGALPLTDTQKREIERRVAEHARDPSSAVLWEEARRRLQQRLG